MVSCNSRFCHDSDLGIKKVRFLELKIIQKCLKSKTQLWKVMTFSLDGIIWEHLGSPWAPLGALGLPNSGKIWKIWFVAHPKEGQREAKRVQKVTKMTSKVEKKRFVDRIEKSIDFLIDTFWYLMIFCAYVMSKTLKKHLFLYGFVQFKFLSRFGPLDQKVRFLDLKIMQKY